MPEQSPPPVYADDTSLFDLRTPELFIVTVLRLWAAGHGDTIRPADWPNAFRAVGIEEGAAPAFGSLIRIVASAARRPLDIRVRHCRWLGGDEGRLLRLISLMQRDRLVEASAVLADWLPPAAARLVMRDAQILADALARSGLVVPLRHAEAASWSSLAAYAHATPGLALLQ
jgi:hypothetical protein